MLKLGVKTCDLTVALNMFHGTQSLPHESPKCRQMVFYEKLSENELFQKTIKW